VRVLSGFFSISKGTIQKGGIMKNACVHHLLTMSIFAILYCYSSWHTIGAQSPNKEGVLDTQGIVIRDNKGAIKVRVGTKADGSAVLTFLDNKQQARIEIGLQDETLPTIQLWDEKQMPRLILSLKEKKGTCITVLNSDGGGVFELSTLADGTVQEFFFDRTGDQRIRQIVRPNGKSELCLLGTKERSGIWMGVSESGDVRQSFFDRDEKERITLNVDRTGNTLSFLSKDRKARIVTSETANGTALNVLYDELGNRRVGTYVNARGDASQVLYGPRGHRGLVLASEGEIPGSLNFCDLNGNPKCGASVGRDGEPTYFWLKNQGVNGKEATRTLSRTANGYTSDVGQEPEVRPYHRANSIDATVGGSSDTRDPHDPPIPVRPEASN
jgi:WD40 repeat protein